MHVCIGSERSIVSVEKLEISLPQALDHFVYAIVVDLDSVFWIQPRELFDGASNICTGEATGSSACALEDMKESLLMGMELLWVRGV